MLSLPTGHYVNTYAPLEKKAAISAQPVRRDASYCGERSGGCSHQRKTTGDAVSTWLCIGRIIVYSCERSAPDVHLLPPLRCCACEYLYCSVHQKVAQDPPRLLAQGAKAGTPVLCIAPRPEETAAAAAVPGFQHPGSKPVSIPRRPDLLVRIEAFLWPA